MNVSVILGHPNQKSLNYAIYERVIHTLQTQNHQIYAHDLYAEHFEAVITGYELQYSISKNQLVEQHCEEIKNADVIIIIHPNWWGQPPAILKGWVDRVLRPKTGYDVGPQGPFGLLKAKKALVFNTSNTPMTREKEVLGDPLESIWKLCTFQFCGVHQFFRKTFCVVEESTPEMRSAWLDEVSEMVLKEIENIHMPRP